MVWKELLMMMMCDGLSAGARSFLVNVGAGILGAWLSPGTVYGIRGVFLGTVR